MKTLDRYIFGKFLRAFFFVLVLLTLIISLVDFTEKNGYFIRHQLGIREILDYYSAYIVFVINFISPITVFVTTVFITSQMAQHSEIIAMLSSGVSFSRLLMPYLAGALLIALGNFYLTGWGLARANKKRIAFEVDHIPSFYTPPVSLFAYKA